MVGLIKGVLEGTPISDLELPTKETGNHKYSVGLLAHAGIYSVSDISGSGASLNRGIPDRIPVGMSGQLTVSRWTAC
jgi:hypothetical protein